MVIFYLYYLLDLYNFYALPIIIRMIEPRRMKWLEDVACEEEMRNRSYFGTRARGNEAVHENER